MTEAYRRSTYWRKWVEYRIITEDGAYAATDDPEDTQVPDDYSGSELTVEVDQRVIFTDGAGHLIELRQDDLHNVFDSGGQDGIGVEILDANNQVIETIEPLGPSSHKTKWYYRESPFTSSLVTAKGEFIKSLADAEITEEEG